MSIQPKNLLNGQAASADYPQGFGRDEVTPGVSDDGTVLIAEMFNDQFGFFQGLLFDDSVVPSDIPDTVLLSDYKDALGRFLARGGNVVTRSSGMVCVIGKINKPLNGGGAITLNLPTTGLYPYATVLFSPDPDIKYSTNPVNFAAVVGNIGSTGFATEAIVNIDDILGGFQRDGTNTFWVPIMLRKLGTKV